MTQATNAMLLQALEMMQEGRAGGRVVPNIAALRQLPAKGSLNAVVLGSQKIGDNNGGVYWQDIHDKTSADNGRTIIVAKDGMRWKLAPEGVKAASTSAEGVSVLKYGAIGDGKHDDSAAIQKALDQNKGGTILIPEGRYLHAGVKLDGTAYNGTKIICRGEMLLRPRTAERESNLQGAFVGLIIRNCENIEVHYRGDGNRKLQSMQEHCFNVAVAGAKNIRFPTFSCREVRGDAVYITQSDLHHESPPAEKIYFGRFDVENSEDDGRNAMSIISGKDIVVDDFRSVRVGGKVNVMQPGGFDIEPNTDFQIVDNVWLKKVYIDTAGNFGLQCFGKGRNRLGGNVSNLRVDDFDVRTRCDGRSSALVCFRHCRNITLKGRAVMANPSDGHHVGLMLDNVDGAKIDMTIQGGLYSALASYEYQVNAVEVNVTVTGYRRAALATASVSNSRFNVKASNGGRRSSALYTRSWTNKAIQTNTVYQIDCPQNTTQGDAAAINDTLKSVRFNGVSFAGGNLTGYTKDKVLVNFDKQVRLKSVRGVM